MTQQQKAVSLTPHEIKTFRLMSGLTVLELATKIGYSRGTIYAWQRGDTHMSHDTVVMFLDVIEQTIQSIAHKKQAIMNRF